MSDLSPFIADEDREDSAAARLRWRAPLLLLRFGDALYGVHAGSVENVMGYRAPARVPHGHPALAGFLQDRGRMLALLRHPAGEVGEKKARPTRVVVCKTRRGRVGLPASLTHAIHELRAVEAPDHLDLIDSPEGAVCFLDVERLAESLAGEVP